MITINKKTVHLLENGEITIKDVAQDLLEKYPITEIATALAELLTTKQETVYVEQPKITVTQQEYEQITGMFRVRGTSNRGRKAKTE